MPHSQFAATRGFPAGPLGGCRRIPHGVSRVSVWPIFRRIFDPYHQYEPANAPKTDLKRPSDLHHPEFSYTLLEARPETPSRLQIANEAQSAAPQVLDVAPLRRQPSGTTSRTSSQFSLREGFSAGPLARTSHRFRSEAAETSCHAGFFVIRPTQAHLQCVEKGELR